MTEIQTQFLTTMTLDIANGKLPTAEELAQSESYQWDGDGTEYDQAFSRGQAEWNTNHPDVENPATGITGLFVPDAAGDDDDETPTAVSTITAGLTARIPHPCGGYYDEGDDEEAPGSDL